MIARHSQLHRDELVGHLARGNEVFRSLSDRLDLWLAGHGVASPRVTSYAVLDRLLDQQAPRRGLTWMFSGISRSPALPAFPSSSWSAK